MNTYLTITHRASLFLFIDERELTLYHPQVLTHIQQSPALGGLQIPNVLGWWFGLAPATLEF